MTVRKLTLEIVAGDKTCASEPGVFCPHLVPERWGSVYACQVFGERPKENEDFWLDRLPQCLEAENK